MDNVQGIWTFRIGSKRISIVTTSELLEYYTEDEETTSIEKYDGLKIPEFEGIITPPLTIH
jgi:hypothetical protein